ncbi:MAG: phosphotransferase [Planctomycetes bacterium]|nr:phosphotransferase [Planctomycetota bacterium]
MITCSLNEILDSARDWLYREVGWPPGITLDGVRLLRLWPGRPGPINFELELQLTQQGRQRCYALQGGLAAGEGHGGRRSRIRVSSRGLFGLRLTDGPERMWVCTPDRDHKLPKVRTLLHPAELRERLAGSATASYLGMDDETARLRSRVVTYRAEKRCVIRARADGPSQPPRVYIKLLQRPIEPDAVATVNHLTDFFRRQRDVTIRVPTTLDVWPTDHLWITADVGADVRKLGVSSEETKLAAQALSTLHSAPLTPKRRHAASDELATTRRWASIVDWLRSDADRHFGELLEQLTARLKPLDDHGTSLVHCDYYHAQLLQTPDSLWMVDLDNLAWGHPELDVATMTAHLMLERLAAGCPIEDMLTEGGSFGEMYRRAGSRICEKRFAFYLPCALTRLGALHLPRPNGLERAHQLWSLAQSCLDGDGTI